MTDVFAPALVLEHVHTITTASFGGQSVGLTLAHIHDLDVSPDVVYNGFLMLRSADRTIELSGELGKGSFNDLSRPTRAGVFDVVGRVKSVSVTSVRGGITSSFSLLFYDEEADVIKARSLFAAGSALEVRVCPESLLKGSWISVLDVIESRLPYADFARKFSVQFMQTEKPS